MDLQKQKLFSRLQNRCALWVVLAFGLLLSVYPHFLQLARTGNPAWVSDRDEYGLYVLIAAKSYWNHPLAISDPISPDRSPIKYPWLQFAPFSALTRALGLPPEDVSLLWRIWAGLSIGLGWFLVLRKLLPTLSLVLPFALLLLADPGLLEAKLIAKQYALFASLPAHSAEIFESKPSLHAGWRIISPGLSLGMLLFFYAAYLHGRKQNSRWNFLLPGLLGGILFHTYFYYWTAVALGMVLALLLLREERLYLAKISALAALIGSVEIVKGYLIKKSTNSDWLPRSDKFLPISHFSELILPKVGFALLFLSFYLLWKKRDDLRFLLLQATAGLLLLNHQIFSGLQIENFHWCYHWGPTLSLVVLAGFGPSIVEAANRKIPRFALLAGIFLALHLGLSLFLRHLEITYSRNPQELNALLNTPTPAAPLSRQCTAGDPWIVELFAMRTNNFPLDGYIATISPIVSNHDWHERIAFNSVLLGKTEADFFREQKQLLDDWVWGPWTRQPGGLGRLLEERMQAFRFASTHRQELMQKYRVHYLITAGRKPLPYRVVGSRGKISLYELPE
jgi:hypothetical protein